MSNRSADRWSRREFLTTVAAAGTGVVLGLRSEAIAAEPPPEITKLRTTAAQPGICAAGPIVAEALWRAEASPTWSTSANSPQTWRPARGPGVECHGYRRDVRRASSSRG